MPTSNDTLKELILEEDFLEVLQSFIYPSKSGDERQVKVDLQRMYGLTIKDELTEWTYIKSFEGSAIKTPARIDPDPDEVFFSRIKSLDKKFQDFILLNFHQGGMFYAAKQFLTFNFIPLGFIPSSTEGSKHHITFDFTNSEELVIKENFSITALDFIENTSSFKVIPKDGEFRTIDLEQYDKDKIFYLQEYIMESLCGVSSNYQQAKLQLEKNSETKKTRLSFNSDENINLIEFTLKYTLRLDPASANGITVNDLSKEDISFKVQEGLYDISSQTSNPEFAKLLSPNLQCVSFGFFAKPKFTNKLNELILNSYRGFILILLNIIFKLKASFFASTEPSESQKNFVNRMHA